MTDEIALAGFRNWVLSVLATLSATVEDQRQYLRENGIGLDEIFLQLDDVMYISRSRVDGGTLDREHFALLEGFSRQVFEFGESVPVGGWTLDFVESVESWGALRRSAQRVADVLGGAWAEDVLE